MNSLPKTVTRQRRGCDLNPGPSLPESSTLTTRLPSNPINAVRGELIELWAYVPLHRFCVNSIGCQYRDELSSRLHVWHTTRLRQQHRRTYLSADIQLVSEHGRHHLRSSSLQNTRCSTHTYHSLRQKFCRRRTACVEQLTGYYKTDHQLWTV